MDVRCEQCKTDYVFDDERISEAGVTVRCTECGNVFKVRRTAAGATTSAEPPPPASTEPVSRPWLLRKQSGEVFSFESLATLHKWIVERRATRTDEISRSGQSWKKLGDIAELATFFHVVDQADLASTKGTTEPPPAPPAEPPVSPPAHSLPGPPVAQPGAPVAQPGAPVTQPSTPSPAEMEPAWMAEGDSVGDGIGDIDDEDFEEFRRGGAGKWVAALALVAVAGAGVFYYLDPDRAMGLVGLGSEETEEFAGAEADAQPPEAAALESEESLAEEGEEADGEGAAEEGEAVAEAEAEATDEAEPAAAEEPEQVEVAEAPAAKQPEAAKQPSQRRPPTFQGVLRQALNARNRGQIERSLDLYARASEMRPNRPEGFSGQGFCYIEMRAWHAAIAAFDQALEQEPRHGESIIGLAEAHRLQGNEERAKSLYERYLRFFPEGPEAAVARTNLERM